MSHIKASLLVLLAAFIWGIAFYFQKIAMDHIGPLQFLGLRATLAALTLAPFAYWEARKTINQNTEVLRYAGLGGALFFVAGAVQQIGIATATVTNTGFLTALYVVVTPFLIWFIQRQPPSRNVWLAVFVAFLGIWALGGGTLSGFSKGDMLVAASAIGWSFFMVNVSMAGSLAKPLQITCLTFVVVAALGWGSSLIFESHSWGALKSAAPAILYVGVFSSALTFVLMAIAVRHIPATHATVLLSTETLFAAAAGYVMLGERLKPIGWIGAALMLSAILLIQLGGKNTKSSEPASSV